MIVTDRPDEVGVWIAERARGTWVPGQGTAVGFYRDGRLIAGVSYSMWNGANVWCAVAHEDRRWLNRTNLWAIFHYPFEQLNCKRISALVYESNTRSQRFLTKLGFTREATLEDAAPEGDMFVYRLRKEDCKWLSDLRWKAHERRRLASSGTGLHRGCAGTRALEPRSRAHGC